MGHFVFHLCSLVLMPESVIGVSKILMILNSNFVYLYSMHNYLVSNVYMCAKALL